MATSDRGLRALARAHLGLGAFFAISFVVGVFLVRTTSPYRDDWDWLAWRVDGPVTLARLLSPQNEHVPLLPKLIFVLQFAIEKSRNDLVTVAAVLMLVVSAAIILNVARRHAWPLATTRAIAIGAGATILFLSWQLQSMLYTTTIAFPLVELLAVTAFVCLVNATDASKRSRGWLAGAFAAAAAAMLTTSPGLLVPLVAAVIALCRRARRSVVGVFTAMFAAGLTGYVLVGPAHNPTIPLATAGQTIALFFSFFASFASYRWPAVGIAVGVVVFGAGLLVVSPVLRRSSRASRLDHLSAAIVMFTIGTALAVSWARGGFGAEQGAQSRYATFVLPCWCAIWLSLWNRVCQTEAPRARKTVGAIALIVSLALVPLHVLTAIVWRAKSDNVSVAALALQSGVEDQGWLHTLHPVSGVVTNTAARLRALGDNAFQLPQTIVGAEDVRALTACAAGFLALPLTRAGDYELRSSLDTVGDRGLVLDRTGTLIGLVRVAPAVASSEPSHEDVIAAVLRGLRSGRPRQWLGFAHATQELPATVVVERHATPVCRASISAG